MVTEPYNLTKLVFEYTSNLYYTAAVFKLISKLISYTVSPN